MFDVVLYSPQIPPNTGNVIRLCANTGVGLHLVEPLGFQLDEARVRRAGLDYRDMAVVSVHPSLDAARAVLRDRRWFATTARGGVAPHRAQLEVGDVFLFGPEPTGLPGAVVDAFATTRRLRLPMVPASRSLNLSNAVAVTVYEAWRQAGFAGAQ